MVSVGGDRVNSGQAALECVKKVITIDVLFAMLIYRYVQNWRCKLERMRVAE